MTLRFQADVNLNQLMLRAVCRREPALDFHTAEAAGLGGLLDPEVLARTADAGRVLVTHDLQTMPRHFAEFITIAAEHKAARSRVQAYRLEPVRLYPRRVVLDDS